MQVQVRAKNSSALTERVARSVHERTSGTIRGLRVDVLDGHVVLSGKTSSYYNKQLATHAALQSVDDLPLTNEIQVG